MKRSSVILGWVTAVMLLAVPVVARAETTPPTAPGNLQAAVASGDPTVTLSWAASTDASGIKAYRIDRSLDQAEWTTLSGTVAALTYADKTSGFGLHYYYRVAAIDNAGNVSAWAATDVSTDDVNSGPSGSSEATYTSSDKLVVVQMPAGTADSEMSCTLDSLVDVNGKDVGSQSSPVILGPYQLSCKTPAGSIVTEFKKKAVWTLDIKGQLKNGLKDPAVYLYNPDAYGTVVKSQYDEKGQSIRVELPPNSIVTVQASKPKVLSLSLVSVILAVAGVIAGIIILVVNRKRKLQYEEYLRSKYYEI